MRPAFYTEERVSKLSLSKGSTEISTLCSSRAGSIDLEWDHIVVEPATIEVGADPHDTEESCTPTLAMESCCRCSPRTSTCPTCPASTYCAARRGRRSGRGRCRARCATSRTRQLSALLREPTSSVSAPLGGGLGNNTKFTVNVVSGIEAGRCLPTTPRFHGHRRRRHRYSGGPPRCTGAMTMRRNVAPPSLAGDSAVPDTRRSVARLSEPSPPNGSLPSAARASHRP